jgi:dTDP-4-dehydrorhamnose reductase
MKILLLGKNGQLGWELQRCLPTIGEILSLDYPEIDLSTPVGFDHLRQVIGDFRPSILINATAYTAVDHAESAPGIAYAVNAQAPAVMAEEARRLGAFLLHYSTDYVFDGKKGSPYTEQDIPNPLNVYGKSKLEGEQAIQAVTDLPAMILRTTWVYTTRASSFVTKVLEWSRSQKVLRLVSDQVSGPTWARLLAEASAQVLAMAIAQPDPRAWLDERCGLYHLGGDGYASRLEWGTEILRLDPHNEEQTVTEIQPALTSDFPSPAERPLFSALNCTHFSEVFGLRLPPWQAALSLAMNPLKTTC